MKDCTLRAGGVQLFRQLDAESRTLSQLGVFDENMTLVIFFYDTASQREAESPAAFLRRETRGKHIIQVFFANALASILYLNDYTVGLLHQR